MSESSHERPGMRDEDFATDFMCPSSRMEANASNSVGDPSARPKALLLAYACVPGGGSESGIGWNRVVQASRYADCWVICEGRECEDMIRQFEEDHGPLPNVKFAFLPLTKAENTFSKFFGTFYFAYRHWHRRALSVARRLHAEVGFDLVHQVNIIGYREPGDLYRLELPTIWGPVGGTQNLPWRFIPGMGLAGGSLESLRNVLNVINLKFSRRILHAAKASDVLIAANRENALALERRFGRDVIVQRDTGLDVETGHGPRVFPSNRPFRFVWSGSVIPRKALHLLLKALADIPDQVSWELRVCGDGPMTNRMKRLARKLGIDGRITWMGWQTRTESAESYRWADAFAFTSLRDTTGTVVFEALSNGLPIVCLNHNGAGEVVDDSSGIRVPVETPRQVRQKLTESLVKLATDAECYQELSEGALLRVRSFTWDRLGDQMGQVYGEVLGRSLADQSKRMEKRAKKSMVNLPS